MAVKEIATEMGHAIPPEGPHTITVHARGWDTTLAFRDGDQGFMQKIRSIYPRFMPFGPAQALSAAIHQKLSFPPTHGCHPFSHPDVFSIAQEHAFSHHRKEPKLEPADLIFKVVDIAGVRLYCVGFPMAKAPGIIGVWQNVGTGVSTRLSEHLLTQADTLVEVPFNVPGDGDVSVEKVPTATYLPEVAAHQALRERIVGLLNRAPVAPQNKAIVPDDIYFHATGMAAIYRLHVALTHVRKGPVVALGALFHGTYHLLSEFPDGFKHFGQCNAQSGVADKLEAYLQEEAKAGRKVSYIFVEFPSNPILVSVDLKRLRQLADQYDTILVIDDTIGSFCNIDVLPVGDSFSGYADVMGGSIILNPSSRHYPALKKFYKETFRNEYFAGDAEKLLSNSADYLPRSTILNRNATAIADLLQAHVGKAGSPVLKVLYPSVSDTVANYAAFMRPATTEFTPGYGCLLSIDFTTLAAARAFYDNLHVHHGPHLGAHLTLAFNYNDCVLGKEWEEFKYHVEYGLRREQVRIAVGLEEVRELVLVFQEALKFAVEALKEGET
ncbi:putative cystathionine gamma-synthase protein [Mycena sanguinolenta]|uniref:Putative cystathionine gamma-synthase protein n=1 Tax=Mycena sanguinolenta TaxID=230812 RepID=A0A8H7CYS4_9AGAR|nr:putative cystathionine gamma-synthase protein [Mycena sanguinolenta]